MGFFGDIIEYSYLSNAVIAAMLAGITCGVVGTYIVARRLVFLCGGITHSSFGGLGIAFYLGINPLLGALLFAAGSAIGIEWASEKGKIREDSAIGIIWSVGMALGALFLSLSDGYSSGDMASYLFGSIITVSGEDVALIASLCGVIVVGSLLWWRQIMYIAFDRRYAACQGIATRVASYALCVVVAITIVLAIRIMGIVLLLSLFTIPVVTANCFTKSYAKISIYSALIGSAGAFGGLWASYEWEIPTGVSIIFVLTIALIAAKLLSLRSKKITKCA